MAMRRSVKPACGALVGEVHGGAVFVHSADRAGWVVDAEIQRPHVKLRLLQLIRGAPWTKGTKFSSVQLFQTLSLNGRP